MDLPWMKVFPGNLMASAMGLSSEDKGRYYEAVFHLWLGAAMPRAELEARIGPISAALMSRLDAQEGGDLSINWLEKSRVVQVAAANKNSSNRKGKTKGSSGISTGKTKGTTTSKSTLASSSISASTPFPESEELREVWREWESHRREINKALTTSAIKQQFRQIETLGLERSIAAIRFSIANGYQGIFEPKFGPSVPDKPKEPRYVLPPGSIKAPPIFGNGTT